MKSERDQAIENLTNEINKHNDVQLTVPQVEHWVGSDTSLTTIINDYHDVKSSKGKDCVNPDDVLSLWDDTA